VGFPFLPSLFKALPRQVWFDNATQSNLIQWPIEEFSELRRSNVSETDVVLESGSVFEVAGGAGAQVKNITGACHKDFTFI
jgi:hypothetical protein